MNRIPISKFKATCRAVLDRVRQTGEPVIVTRRGVPVAEIRPPPEAQAGGWLGSMAGMIEVVSDIITSPAEPNDAWGRFARETAADAAIWIWSLTDPSCLARKSERLLAIAIMNCGFLRSACGKPSFAVARKANGSRSIPRFAATRNHHAQDHRSLVRNVV